MQQLYHIPKNPVYTIGMGSTGRPAKQERTPFGERVVSAREQKGFNQRELSELLGISQRALSWWERQPAAIKPNQLAQLAVILEVSTDYLVGHETNIPQRSGPVGKAQKMFEEVSSLPKRQQQRILAAVEDMIAGQKAKAAS